MFFDYYPNGSLYDIFQQQRKDLSNSILNSTNKLIIIYGIAAGMAFLHLHNILHRDLSSNNVLLDEYIHPKISEFGSSKEVDDIKTSYSINATTYKYMAPEFISDYYKYNRTKPIDVYSFAIIMYEIVTNDEPYGDSNTLKIVEKKQKNEKPEFKGPISNCYRNLIERCWSQEPTNRPTFDEIVYELENNKNFITENSIDTIQYYKYIEYIKNPDTSTFGTDDIIQIERNNYESKFNFGFPPIDLTKFEKTKNKIGSGSFGKVYKVKEKQTGEIYACKISHKSVDNWKDIEIKNMQQEIKINSKLNHPLILKFIGFNIKNFKEDLRPTFITEFAVNGSLEEILDIYKKGILVRGWNNTKKLINIYGIAKGMSYLHSLDILHRDLKPGNIFIDEYLFPKIGDFGLSKEINTNETDQSTKGTIQNESGTLGTSAYISPEIMSDNLYTKSGDVYAFAMIVYQIVTNEKLFEKWTLFQLLLNVKDGYRPNIPSYVKECYRNLIEKCWNQNPEERPTFDEIVEDLETNRDFITESIDEIEFFDYVEYIKQIIAENKPNNDENQSEHQKETLAQSFKPITIDLKLNEETYEEDDPIFKEGYIDLSDYEEVKEQSQGDTWKLWEVKNKTTNEVFSAKITTVKLSKMNRKDLINLSREINNISQIKHPCILRFIGYSRTDFQGKKNPVIVNEYAYNGTISTILKQERKKQGISKWNETLKLIIIYGIAVGMRYLHFHKTIHRDLTPENIYLDDKMNPKIGNFGLSTHIHSRDSMTFQSTIGIKGNPVYTAPEVLQTNEYSKSSDVYSFGMIVYEIMTNTIPFEKLNSFNQLINEVVFKSSRPEIKEEIPECYRKLIEYCWSQNPDERPTFDEIVKILKTDSSFITSKVDYDKYLKYIKTVANSEIEFVKGKKLFQQDDFINDNDDNTVSKSSSSDVEEDKDNQETISNQKNKEHIEIQNQFKKALKSEETKIEDDTLESKELKVKISEEPKELENEMIEELKERKGKIVEEPKELEAKITEEPKALENEITEESKERKGKIVEETKEQENEMTEESKERETKITEEPEALENKITEESKEKENHNEKFIGIENAMKFIEETENINLCGDILPTTVGKQQVNSIGNCIETNLNDDAKGYIEECISSSHLKELIEFLNEEVDFENTSKIFDRIHLEKEEIYEQL